MKKIALALVIVGLFTGVMAAGVVTNQPAADAESELTRAQKYAADKAGISKGSKKTCSTKDCSKIEFYAPIWCEVH